MIRLVVKIAAIIFFAEAVIMLGLALVESAPSRFPAAVIDAAFLVMLSSPLIYLWVIKPYIEDRNEAYSALKKARDELNIKVEERTRKLADSEQRLSFMIATSPAEIYTAKPYGDHALTFISGNVTKLLGYAPEEFLSDPEFWVGHIHPDDVQKVLDDLNAVMKERDRCVHEYRFRKNDGSYCWMRDEHTVVRNDEGNPLEIVGCWVDITEHKRLEQQLRRAQKVESLGTLAGGITHELNNLLLPITSLTRMALKNLPPDNPERGKLEKVVEAGDRAKEVVKQMLAFSRTESPHREKIEIAVVILNALKLIRVSSPSTIRIEEQLDENAGVVYVDADQIKTALMCLTSNALDAMEGKIGEMKVSLARIEIDEKLAGPVLGLETGTYAKLSVSDTGCGMDEETLERIYDPFFTTKEVGQGTGLGLSVVQGIVQQHGGAIRAVSEIGRGTTFDIYLPLANNDGAL